MTFGAGREPSAAGGGVQRARPALSRFFFATTSAGRLQEPSGSCKFNWLRVQSSMSSMKDALLFRKGLGHNANGRSLVMTPELSSDRAVRNTEVAGLAILAGSALAHSSALVATVRLEWRRRCVAARGVARV